MDGLSNLSKRKLGRCDATDFKKLPLLKEIMDMASKGAETVSRAVSRSTFAPSPITSDDSDIITIIGIELNGSRSCFVVIA
jgi:hypothetical protein